MLKVDSPAFNEAKAQIEHAIARGIESGQRLRGCDGSSRANKQEARLVLEVMEANARVTAPLYFQVGAWGGVSRSATKVGLLR